MCPPRNPNALRRDSQYLADKQKRWRAANPEKLAKQRARAWGTRAAQYKANPARYLWRVAKYRAAKYGVPFDIDPEDIVIPTCCPITGEAIDVLTCNARNGASVDRFQNDRGYVKGNVRVISRKANRWKNDMTVQDVERLLAYMRSEP